MECSPTVHHFFSSCHLKTFVCLVSLWRALSNTRQSARRSRIVSSHSCVSQHLEGGEGVAVTVERADSPYPRRFNAEAPSPTARTQSDWHTADHSTRVSRSYAVLRCYAG